MLYEQKVIVFSIKFHIQICFVLLTVMEKIAQYFLKQVR